ncbi:MAG TPA: hypothetical protein VGF99_05920 [Myxococcota bacterium]
MGVDWHRYLMSTARDVVADDAGDLDDDAPAFISGQLLCRHAAEVGVPVVEITVRRAAVLAAFLRACRQADAVGVVVVPAGIRNKHPGAAAAVLKGVVASARAGRHDRPLVVVARADTRPLWFAPGSDAVDAGLERVARDLDAGFGAIGIGLDLVGDGDSLARLCGVLAAGDVGIELEVGAGEDAALLLAEIDDRGLPVSAIRGANVADDVGRATRVVDLAEVRAVDEVGAGGLRVNIDALIDNALRRVDPDDDDAVEATAWMAISRALTALKAAGSATALAEALALDDGSAA